MAASTYLLVSIESDHLEGELGFLNDLVGRLVVIGRRSGIDLVFEQPERIGMRGRRSEIRGDLPVELKRELGLHRAQVVPKSSPTGRVQTVSVSVSRVEGSVELVTASTPAIRTYNYPLRSVVCHAAYSDHRDQTNRVIVIAQSGAS